jgi:hypothetical protein
MVSIYNDHISLFFTGGQHAGENLVDLLAKREADLGPPIQMCDALTRNLPKDFETLVANCTSHGRRRFAEVSMSIFHPKIKFGNLTIFFEK